MIDEFDQLGRMGLFVEAMKTLRSFGGRVMIVTQSTPGLDAIYGENARLSLEAAAIIILPAGQHPVKARRILASILAAQTGPLPWPEPLTSHTAALADASRRAVRAEEIATALRADTARLEGLFGA